MNHPYADITAAELADLIHDPALADAFSGPRTRQTACVVEAEAEADEPTIVDGKEGK